jgi:2'-deoxynucleoside 5'-phosphate N-hydrolase
MPLKIYFAGSIRAGREDRQWYGQILEVLKDYGEVLSEHVADQGDEPVADQLLTDRQIFHRDIQWLRQAHTLVAEVTTPSLGVGYELGFAEALKIPALCLFRGDSDRRLSAMIGGGLYFENTIAKYNQGDIEGVKKIIDDFFKTSVAAAN